MFQNLICLRITPEHCVYPNIAKLVVNCLGAPPTRSRSQRETDPANIYCYSVSDTPSHRGQGSGNCPDTGPGCHPLQPRKETNTVDSVRLLTGMLTEELRSETGAGAGDGTSGAAVLTQLPNSARV